MSTAELADNATHAQIQEFVDQAVKDVALTGGETDSVSGDLNTTKGLGPDKTDTQQLAEEHDEPVTERTTAETDSGSEDTASDGDEAGDSEDQAREWLDDDLKAEVAAYGIDEEELAEFTSREEVERAMRFFDRSEMEAGRKARAADDKGPQGPAVPEGEQARDEQGKFAKPKEGQYEIGLNRDLWDDDAADDLTGEFTRMRDHYESRVGAMEEQFAAINATAKQHEFDAAVDTMGHADLFGKTGRESKKELARRQELLDACEDVEAGRQLRGREVGPYESLVSRVAKMVFADDLDKKRLKARTRKMSAQNKKIMGGGSSKPSGPEESLEEWADRRYKELENV